MLKKEFDDVIVKRGKQPTEKAVKGAVGRNMRFKLPKYIIDGEGSEESDVLSL